MVVGCRGPVEINPRLMMGTEAMIRGVALGASTDSEVSEAGEAVVRGVREGWIEPVVDKEYPMEQARQAHVDIIESKGAKGKLVLKIP